MVATLSKLSGIPRPHKISDRLINAIKTCLACAIGLSLVKVLQLPQGQWTIITILVVMSAQVHFGSTLQKGYLRFIGTLIGSTTAALCLLAFPHSMLAINITLLVSSLLFSYVAGKSAALGQACTLGAVTVAILLFNDEPALTAVLLRTCEILLGILIAVFVSLFILPIRAHQKLNKKLAEILYLLNAFYNSSIHKDHDKAQRDEIKIMEAFAHCQKLLEEAKTEPGVNKNLRKIIADIILHEKRLFRAISMLEHYYSQTQEPVSLEPYHHALIEQLEKLGLAIENKDNTIISVGLLTINTDILPNYLQFFCQFMAQEVPNLINEIKRYLAYQKLNK